MLEAMACATPVIAARSSSLPEVVGEAGVLVDPLDAEELATQLLRIASDRDQREELAWRGVCQARKFSWARTARQTREVYRGCLGNLGASNR